MKKFIALAFVLASTLAHAAPSYEYKIEKSGRVNLTGLNLGKSRQLGLDEVERLMNVTAVDGWRFTSFSLIQEDAYGGYSFVLVFERQKGGTAVTAAPTPSALAEPTAPPTPRPTLPPRPPPSNDPCAAGMPCVIETFLSTEVTVEIGKRYNVKLKSGELLDGTLKAARRFEIVLENASGSRTITSEQLSNITLR